MTIARIIAAALLGCAGLYCLARDSRSVRVRAERDTRCERLSMDDFSFDLDTDDGLHLGGWFAGMTCLICAAAVVS